MSPQTAFHILKQMHPDSLQSKKLIQELAKFYSSKENSSHSINRDIADEMLRQRVLDRMRQL